MKDQYDQIAEVDTIVEKSEDVEKFNPWHDARGRFASAGRGSFSANPKTKAGQMAIARAYQGGHQTAFNRHKESKGENVHQNYSWINSTGRKGSFPGTRQQPGYTGTTSRRGLNARTRTLTNTKPVNHLPNSLRPGATASKPKSTSNQTASKPKTTSKPAASAQAPASNHTMVSGKNITRTYTPKYTQSDKIMDEIATAQGYKGQGRVEKDYSKFQSAVKNSGIVMYRTLSDGTDVISKQPKKASEFIDMLKTGDEKHLSLNGSGGSAYGEGIYTAAAHAKPGSTPNKRHQMQAADDSATYAGRPGGGKTVAMTLDPSAKVGDYYQIYNEFQKLPRREQKKWGYDEGVYAAAKGYDAVTNRSSGNNTSYTIVYNRTKLIFFDETYDNVTPYNLPYNSNLQPIRGF